MDIDNLPATIIALRQERGWSQTDLARAAGCSRNYISLIERGSANLTLEMLSKILLAFDLGLQVDLIDKEA